MNIHHHVQSVALSIIALFCSGTRTRLIARSIIWFEAMFRPGQRPKAKLGPYAVTQLHGKQNMFILFPWWHEA